MKKNQLQLVVLFVGLSFNLYSQLTNKEIKRLQKGEIKDDTSYVYSLP